MSRGPQLGHREGTVGGQAFHVEWCNVTNVEAPLRSGPAQSDTASEPSLAPSVDVIRALTARQMRIVLGVLALIVFLDQASKAWAWQHLGTTHIDSGAGMLLSPGVGAWYRDAVQGAVLDVIGALVLTGLGLLLVHRRRSRPLLLGVAITLAGWASNLADRLGMHHVTAPGSVRGAVDFLKWDGRTWNMADLAIGCGCALLLAYVVVAAIRRGAPRLRAVATRHIVRSRRRYLADWQRRMAGRVLLASMALASVLAATDLLIDRGASSHGRLSLAASCDDVIHIRDRHITSRHLDTIGIVRTERTLQDHGADSGGSRIA